MEPFETTMAEARRGEVGERVFPHKVVVRRMFDAQARHMAADAAEVRAELTKWLVEQFGPEAIGDILNFRQARVHIGTLAPYLDPQKARIILHPERAWIRCNSLAWRFRDERHAVLFKMRAY